MLKILQDNLAYYQRQKQEIINNKQSYVSVRQHQEYGAWQSTSYTFGYHEILAMHGAAAHNGSPCFDSVHWKKNRYGQLLNNNATTHATIRQAIAQKLGRPIDEINPQLNISGRGDEPTCQFGERAYFNTYTVGYQHRQLHVWQEKYFDQDKYNQALKACEQNIESTRVAIVNAQEQQIDEAKISNLQGQISSVKSQIAKNQLEASHHLKAINAETAKRQDYERKHAKVQAGNAQLQDQLESQKNDMHNMLRSADEKQRAFFLSELWGDDDNAMLISIIKSLGFNASELAYLAILKNHNELLELAGQHKADWSNYMVEGKTLLQHLVHQHKNDMVSKILETEKDISCTLINAVGQNDMVTISRLHSMDSSILQQKFAGYTLLQIAISAENPEIETIKALLALDNTLLETLNSNGESALEIAVRSGHENIIELIKEQIELKAEVDQPTLDNTLKDETEQEDIEDITSFVQEEGSPGAINEIIAGYKIATEIFQENERFNELKEEDDINLQGLNLDGHYI